MRIKALYETSKENGNRLALLPEGTRIDRSGRMLSCIINIDPCDIRQEIYGFGGALTESAGYVLASLPTQKRREVIERYFNEIGYTIGRTHLNSCDFSLCNWAVSDKPGHFDTERSDRYLMPLLKEATTASGGNLHLMVSPWSPPAYMKTNGDMNHGGKLQKEYYGEWAEIFARYLSHLRDNGLDVWACSVQNECEAVQIWDSCLYTAEEETEFIDGYLYEALRRKGFQNVRILVWDHNRDGLYRRLSGSLKHSKGHIKGAAYHWYSGAQYDNVARCRKEFPDMDLIFTEGSIEGGTRKGAWFPGERYGHNIINDLNSGCNAWIDWNIALDEQGGPNHVGNYCDAPVLIGTDGDITYQSSFYYIAHFSSFIRNGARSIATGIDSWMTPATVDGRIADYMEATAAMNPDGTIALAVMNRTEADMLFTLNISSERRKADGYTSGESEKKECVLCCPSRSIQTYIISQ